MKITLFENHKLQGNQHHMFFKEWCFLNIFNRLFTALCIHNRLFALCVTRHPFCVKPFKLQNISGILQHWQKVRTILVFCNCEEDLYKGSKMTARTRYWNVKLKPVLYWNLEREVYVHKCSNLLNRWCLKTKETPHYSTTLFLKKKFTNNYGTLNVQSSILRN